MPEKTRWESLFAALLDPAAAQYDFAVVKHRTLAGSHGALWIFEANLDAPGVRRAVQGGRSSGVLIPDLHLCGPRFPIRQRRNRNPIHVLGKEAGRL